MSRDIKDLIDSIEEEEVNRSDLERTLTFLKEEMERLTFTINEQKLLIQDQNIKLERIHSSEDIPDDIQVLKDMIVSQRQELIKKDKDVDILNSKIENLASQMQRGNKVIDQNAENEKVIEAKKHIVRVSQENEELRKKLNNLTEKIKNVQPKDYEQNYAVNLEKMVVKLTEENEIYQEKIKTLKIQLGEQPSSEYRADSRDLDIADKNVNSLISEIEAFQSQLLYLQEELEKSKPIYGDSSSVSDQPEDFNKVLKEKDEIIEKLQEKNEDLNAQIIYWQQELKQPKTELEEIADSKPAGDIDQRILVIEEENRRLQRNLENSNITIDKLIGEIDGYVKEIAEQGDDIVNRNVKINVLNEKIESLKNRNQLLQDELDDSLKERKFTEMPTETGISMDLGSQHDTELMKKEIKIDGLEQQIANLRLQNREIKNELEDSLEVTKILAEQVEEKESNEKYFSLSIKELEDENQRLTILISQLKEGKGEEESSEREASEKIKELEDENQRLNILISQLMEGQGEEESSEREASETIKKLEDENQRLNILISQLKESKVEEESSEREASETLKKLEDENQRLNNLVAQLQEPKAEHPKEETYDLLFEKNIPISYQYHLFMNMYNNLSENEKEGAIDSLIRDLKSGNYEIKRFAISILGELGDAKCYNALMELIHDKDWLIRYMVAKALGKIGNIDIKEPLMELLKDRDIDVREIAESILKKIDADFSHIPIRENLSLNRWNWSESKKKWVFVELEGGKIKYKYQLKPPEEFMALSYELKNKNEILMETTDPDEKLKLYNELMEISNKMQKMRKGDL